MTDDKYTERARETKITSFPRRTRIFVSKLDWSRFLLFGWRKKGFCVSTFSFNCSSYFWCGTFFVVFRLVLQQIFLRLSRAARSRSAEWNYISHFRNFSLSFDFDFRLHETFVRQKDAGKRAQKLIFRVKNFTTSALRFASIFQK